MKGIAFNKTNIKLHTKKEIITVQQTKESRNDYCSYQEKKQKSLLLSKCQLLPYFFLRSWRPLLLMEQIKILISILNDNLSFSQQNQYWVEYYIRIMADPHFYLNVNLIFSLFIMEIFTADGLNLNINNYYKRTNLYLSLQFFCHHFRLKVVSISPYEF